MGAFFEASEKVTREEFHRFVRPQLKEHPAIQALEYVPRVSAEERQRFEQSVRDEGFRDFSITERKESGGLTEAGIRSEYFPVYYVEPLKGNEEAFGFDLASDARRLEALIKARDSGRMAATAVIRLVQDEMLGNGILVILPLYLKYGYPTAVEDRSRDLTGFVLSVFRVKHIVTSALSYGDVGGMNLHVYDVSDAGRWEHLYSYTSTEIPPVGSEERKVSAGKTLFMEQNLAVADRQWLVGIESTERYGHSSGHWYAWVSALSILLASVLTSIYLQKFTKKSEQVAVLVDKLSTEVSERKIAEEELRNAHERLLTILDSIQALVYVADMQTYEILFVNRYGLETWGDIKGKICWQSLQADQTGPCEFCTNRYLVDRDGRPTGLYEWEFQNTTNNHWYFIHDKAIQWIDGRIVRLEIAMDITESKRLEEELQRSHKLESIGILAGGIAHDFNNLLTAIQNNIYLAKMAVDDTSKAYERLEEMKRAVDRSRNLTHQLLTFSKGGAPVTKPLSIASIVQEAADLVLRGSQVKCVYDFPDNLQSVEADEGQIHQVIHNLVLNAVQSMPEGGTIWIEIRNEDAVPPGTSQTEPGKSVIVRIRDQGAGISEEDRSRIFDPYFTTREEGRGLGLAISYSIVRNHGGHILVDSEVGKGTTVTIYLSASDTAPVPQKSVDVPAPSLEGKILIMDDDKSVRDSLREVLKMDGYEVECAKDGEEALLMFSRARESSRPFDVVILDLTVPGGMGGKEAIKKLRDLDPRVKAAVASGYSNDPVMSNYRDYGFSAVMSKPYRVEELKSMLQDVINGHSDGATNQRS